MKSPNHRPRLAFVALFLLAFCRSAVAALTPDQIVLIANKNLPVSVELAQFYAQQRKIPADHILALDLPFDPRSDEISPQDYRDKVVPAVRDFLTKNHLTSSVTCLITFYGLPLRVSGYKNTPAQAEEVSKLDAELKQVVAEAEAAVKEAETWAAALNSAFRPLPGDSPLQLRERVDAAWAPAVTSRIGQVADATKRGETIDRWLTTVGKLLGPAESDAARSRPDLARLLPPDKRVEPARAAESRARLAEIQKRFTSLKGRALADAAARKEMRDLTRSDIGLLQYAILLESQRNLLDDAETVAALDSELAMLWWDDYPRHRWQTNLLHFKAAGKVPPGTTPMLMVTRLDGPSPQIVKDIITTSIEVEKKGLRGRVVLDGRGLKGGEGYAAYDQSISRLATLIKQKTKLDLTFDEQEAVIQPPRTRDVALYCGWYSVRNYVPAFIFNPGAVGFHVASFELVTLREPKEKGWVRNLLLAGVDATLGPVAEPYLQSFPAADTFFPLLLTGKLTLAEVYWKTTPMASWMQTCIGDPLYTPFKTNPALKVEDLPEPLRGAVRMVGKPTTRPVSSATPSKN